MITCVAVTHESVHSINHVRRFVLDWQLQTRPDFKVRMLHDGPATKVHGGNIQLPNLDISYISTPIRTGKWGAYNRANYLERVDTEFVFFCCLDDQITPKFVEMVLAEFEANPNLDIVMFNLSHWHYQYNPIPLGTYPAVNKADWCSGVVRTSVAKAAGINYPEEYACDGLFWQDVFHQIGNDETRLKVLPNILVVKN